MFGQVAVRGEECQGRLQGVEEGEDCLGRLEGEEREGVSGVWAGNNR